MHPKPASAGTYSLERTMPSIRATSEQRRDRAALDARYGKIGISAVAAALQYKSEPKNPAYAPAAVRVTEDAEAVA